MGFVKAQTVPRAGIIDALTAGLSFAGRRLWLMIIPVAIDVALWLIPRLSVEQLLTRLLVAWDAVLKAVYTPTQLAAMTDVFSLFQDAVKQIGHQADLAMALTTGWLAPTSALASVQANRLLLVSDGVLAPVGIGLQLPGARFLEPATGGIEIGSVWGVVLAGIALWLAAQVLAACYLYWAALSLNGATIAQHTGDSRAAPAPISIARAPFWRVFGRLMGLSLLLGLVVWFLRIPLALMTALAMGAGSSVTVFLFVLSGGITLWLTMSFLVSMFLASDAIVLDGQGFWPGIWRSLVLARVSGIRTLGFVVLVNVLMLGARAVWGIIGGTLAGTAVAILGNGFLTTGMVLASMVYYDGLRREWQAAAASKTRGQVT